MILQIIRFSLLDLKEKSYLCRKFTNIRLRIMVLEFCATNYLSIKEELKLSFIATPLKESCSEPNDLFSLEDTGISLVRSAVVYGANASGKSNVVKAFGFYKRFITESFKNSQAGEAIDVENFRLNATTVKEPTIMEATFTDGEFIYSYGFEVDRQSVQEEWMYKRVCKKRAKEVEVFYREGEATTVHPKSTLIQELVNKKMVRSNALLLSTSAQFNEPTSVSILQWLSDTKVVFCSEDEQLWSNAIKHLDDEPLRKRIIDFAKYADLGIENITKIDNRIVSDHKQYDDEGREVNNVSFAFNRNESEGTVKYFSLAYPIIDALDNGKRIVIDELDSKLHPLLVKRIVALFNDAKTKPKGAQLLFTAHDTFLLGAGLFRRDQVWFTQKNSFGATELFSLAEYKVRSTSPFERDYLLGKYGATPIIGDMEKIFNPSI